MFVPPARPSEDPAAWKLELRHSGALSTICLAAPEERASPRCADRGGRWGGSIGFASSSPDPAILWWYLKPGALLIRGALYDQKLFSAISDSYRRVPRRRRKPTCRANSQPPLFLRREISVCRCRDSVSRRALILTMCYSIIVNCYYHDYYAYYYCYVILL